MTRLLVGLIILLVVRWQLGKLFRPVMPRGRQHQQTRGRAEQKVVSGQMVKDPQCGMYVATDLAVTLQRKDRVLYFCSAECRDSFLRGHAQEA